MNCLTEDQVLAFLAPDGTALDIDQRRAIEGHLDACAECLELMTLVARTSVVPRVGSSERDAPPRSVVGELGRDDDYRDLVTVDPEHYVVGKEIARGGMGRITAARDRRLGRSVAIKELLIESSELRARFEREARITAKLQHPAIVNLLEAGAWPGGEPFYVMKLVIGESLDKVIAGCRTLEARLALLPTVIAAADALAYAHNMQVIHRDLKPANVLVGEFGETVVIDWGFAKDLADPSGAPDDAIGPYRAPANPGETVAGAVIGTPAYMPPEQAQGRPVDERADVYALGAMLYHVLAGAPPFTGQTSDAIITAVIAGPPPSIAKCAPGVPPDLVAIVTKAMAHAAADRYPTAKGLVDDLKKFQTGQLVGAYHYSAWQLLRRWIRRHRTPVAIAAVATAALGVLGIVSVRRVIQEQARTDEQRQVAERSRGEAEDLMNFMLTDLRGKVEPLGRLDLLDDVAKKAVAYYDRRTEDASDAELKTRAVARRTLGDVLAAQGHAEAALAEYKAALAIVGALGQDDPTNADGQAELAVGHERVGDTLYAQGDAVTALAEYRLSQSIDKTLAANDPKNISKQRNYWVSFQEVGDVLSTQGDAAGALAEYRAGLVFAENLDEANPDKQRELAVSYSQIGNVLLDQADAPGALTKYQAALAIFDMRVAKEPANADIKQDLAAIHTRLGNAMFAQGNAIGGLAEFRAAVTIFEVLAAKDPTNDDRQRNLVVGKTKVGSVLFEQGDTTRALAEFQASLVISEAIAAKDPTNGTKQLDLMLRHREIGDVLDARGDTVGALARYRASMTIAKTQAAKDPTNADKQQELAVSHEVIGDELQAQGDMAAALAAYQSSLAISKALAANDPTNALRQAHLSIGHRKVADVVGNPTEALPEYRASLEIADALVKKDPTNANWQALLVSRRSLGNVLLSQGDAASALAEYRAFLVVAEAQAAKDPANAGSQAELALSHEKIGDALAAKGDKTGGLTAYRAGLAVAQRLQAKDPSSASFRKRVTTLANKVATCCGARKRPR